MTIPAAFIPGSTVRMFNTSPGGLIPLPYASTSPGTAERTGPKTGMSSNIIAMSARKRAEGMPMSVMVRKTSTPTSAPRRI